MDTSKQNMAPLLSALALFCTGDWCFIPLKIIQAAGIHSAA